MYWCLIVDCILIIGFNFQFDFLMKSKILIFSAVLAGCGQTGPLQLPQSVPQVSVAESNDKPIHKEAGSHKRFN